MSDTSTPPADDEQHTPAEALAAAMAAPRLRHPGDPHNPSPAALAAFLALPEPGTTIH